MRTGANLCGLMAIIIALQLIAGNTAAARGQRVPPPPSFAGGNIGAWLGSGPIFGFEEPLGPDFGPPGHEGGSDGGWGEEWEGGREWDSGSGGCDSTKKHVATGGCSDGNCQKPTWTGPCMQLCICWYGQGHGGQDLWPKSGDHVEGHCVWLGNGDSNGGCTQEDQACTLVVP